MIICLIFIVTRAGNAGDPPARPQCELLTPPPGWPRVLGNWFCLLVGMSVRSFDIVVGHGNLRTIIGRHINLEAGIDYDKPSKFIVL